MQAQLKLIATLALSIFAPAAYRKPNKRARIEWRFEAGAWIPGRMDGCIHPRAFN